MIHLKIELACICHHRKNCLYIWLVSWVYIYQKKSIVMGLIQKNGKKLPIYQNYSLHCNRVLTQKIFGNVCSLFLFLCMKVLNHRLLYILWTEICISYQGCTIFWQFFTSPISQANFCCSLWTQYTVGKKFNIIRKDPSQDHVYTAINGSTYYFTFCVPDCIRFLLTWNNGANTCE